MVLHPGRRLDTAGDVDPEQAHRTNGVADVPGVESAAQEQRHLRAAFGRELPVEGLAGSAGRSRLVRVQKVEGAAERTDRLHIGCLRHAGGLDHARTGAACDLRAIGRAFVPVQLDQRQVRDVGLLGDLIERLVDEDARDLHLAPVRLGDARGDSRVNRPR